MIADKYLSQRLFRAFRAVQSGTHDNFPGDNIYPHEAGIPGNDFSTFFLNVIPFPRMPG
jgi:hypothetical protein